MARTRKPPPGPDERQRRLWREQQRISDLKNHPRFRAQLEEGKRASGVNKWLTPGLREGLPRLRIKLDAEPAPTPPPKSKRGAPVKLTDAEIAEGIAIVRREEAKHRKRYPSHPLKQTEALRVLKRQLTLKRNGKPMKLSPATLRRRIVRPALGPK